MVVVTVEAMPLMVKEEVRFAWWDGGGGEDDKEVAEEGTRRRRRGE